MLREGKICRVGEISLSLVYVYVQSTVSTAE